MKGSDAKGYAVLVGVGAVAVVVLFAFFKKQAKEAAETAGGLVTGNNAITRGARTTAYEGAGVLGTLGAAADAASGGVLSTIGESLGGWIYDATHFADKYDPSTGLQTGSKIVANGGRATDRVWGRVGSVELRAQ